MNMREQKGFSLLEMLLVLAIVSSLLIMAVNFGTQKTEEMRRDRTVMQMQQILNAAMSYYINKSSWPTPCGIAPNGVIGSSLVPDYILSTLNANSYGGGYYASCNSGTGLYNLVTIINSGASSVANARIIAGRLPMAFVTDIAGQAAIPPTQSAACSGANPPATCNVVVASVNVPGQNLNNARSVNFGGIYSSGSCVPAPNCPPGMSPSILAAPAAVVGANAAVCGTNESNQCTQAQLYPIEAFTVYARGGTVGSSTPALPTDVLSCQVSSVAAWVEPCLATQAGGNIPNDGTLYWRVCLTVTTQYGEVSPSSIGQGKMKGSILAVTRCVPNSGNEQPSGGINVYQN